MLADQQQVSSGEGTVDAEWDQWNLSRENFWAAKARVRGRSVEYLPPSLRDEAYALEENGRWEKIPYQGTERWFWRPVKVAVGWSPFTVGRWTDWYGTRPGFRRNPSVTSPTITATGSTWGIAGTGPRLWRACALGSLSLTWASTGIPEGLSWIHYRDLRGMGASGSARDVLQLPSTGEALDAVVVNNVNITQININVRNYAYVNRAIVVNQNNFYRVNNYTNVRVTNINSTTIINNYRAAPVVNNTVINNFTTNRQRYNYTDVAVNEKPHNTVLNRIQQNQAIIREGRVEKATVLQERVKSIREGRATPRRADRTTQDHEQYRSGKRSEPPEIGNKASSEGDQDPGKAN